MFGTKSCFFRAGVGVVLYSATTCEIFTFERADRPGTWQFVQGGIDHNESTNDALWRELYEETAVSKDMTVRTISHPHLLSYCYPRELVRDYRSYSIIGQTHQWHYVAINDSATIDITAATDKEFRSMRRMPFSELIAELRNQNDFKLPVYEELFAFFSTQIQN